jgi:hypothetical protein
LMRPVAANDNSPRSATVFLLMAQYHGKAVISVDEICRNYFPAFGFRKIHPQSWGAGISQFQ